MEIYVKVLKSMIILFFLAQLMACAKMHNLAPIYDKDAKTLSVDSLLINPVSYFNEKKNKFGNISGGRTIIKYFKIDDKICNELQVQQVVPDANVYLNYSASDRIMIENNDSCLTQKIGNIYSLRCMSRIDGDIGLYMTSSVHQHSGYGRQITYVFPNNECLEKFESYFIDKTQPKKIGLYESNKLELQQEVFLRKMVD